jgi:hypothetical protein
MGGRTWRRPDGIRLGGGAVRLVWGNVADLVRSALFPVSNSGVRSPALLHWPRTFDQDIRRLHVPVVSKSPEQAADHFGWLAHFAGVDCPASSELTEEKLEWQPKQPGLIADLERGTYFEPEQTTHAAPWHRQGCGLYKTHIAR